MPFGVSEKFPTVQMNSFGVLEKFPRILHGNSGLFAGIKYPCYKKSDQFYRSILNNSIQNGMIPDRKSDKSGRHLLKLAFNPIKRHKKIFI